MKSWSLRSQLLIVLALCVVLAAWRLDCALLAFAWLIGTAAVSLAVGRRRLALLLIAFYVSTGMLYFIALLISRGFALSDW